ncbi:MAG: hypothetical protein CMJ64_19360 [Planctomycetaceae bacterium]|jgi:hypothetical protein|nr:hypothetical protein [Planctomycetaceae bacterium]
MQPQNENVKQSYPLSALFVLVAACVVICALLTPVVRAVIESEIGGQDTAVASMGGSVVSMFVGAIIGLYHYRPFRGLTWGILTGGVIGMIVGPIILAPPDSLGSLMTMSLGGALVLIVTGMIFGTVIRDSEKNPVEKL